MNEEIIFIRNLQDVMCDENQINQALLYYHERKWNQLCRLLKKQRCQLLDKLHEKQKQIDALDYMLYELKRKC